MSRYYESCSTYSVTDQNTDRGNHSDNNAHTWTPINHLFNTNHSHKIYLMIIYLARDCTIEKQRYSLAVWSWILWAWLTKMLLNLTACYSSWLIRPTLWNSDFLWTSSDVHANQHGCHERITLTKRTAHYTSNMTIWHAQQNIAVRCQHLAVDNTRPERARGTRQPQCSRQDNKNDLLLNRF